jgi:collagen triple helix repeat protein
MQIRNTIGSLIIATIIFGCTGSKGSQGQTGPAGQNGATGQQGPPGQVGQKGSTGPMGSQGLQGEAGPQGEAGIMGLQGIMGQQGEAGQQGPMGQQAPVVMVLDAGPDAGICANPNGTLHLVYNAPDGGACGEVINYPPLLANGDYDLLWLGERIELSSSACELVQSVENITSNNCNASLTALCYGFGFVLEEQVLISANQNGFTGTLLLQEADNSSNVLCEGEYSVVISQINTDASSE